MNKSKINKWIEELKNLWIEKAIDEVPLLFTEDCKYYEDPFLPPGRSRNEIKAFWEEVKSQDINKLDIKLISLDGNQATARWNLELNNGEKTDKLDGIYLLKFNEDILCSEFRQWWVLEE